MGESDRLTEHERRTRGATHRAEAIRNASLCADRRDTRVALSELLRSAGLCDESARLDGLGLEFRYSLRGAMADEFVRRRGLRD